MPRLMDNRFFVILASSLLPVNRGLFLVFGAVTKVQVYMILIGNSGFLVQSLKVGDRPFRADHSPRSFHLRKKPNAAAGINLISLYVHDAISSDADVGSSSSQNS
jgi:hypothetical protein